MMKFQRIAIIAALIIFMSGCSSVPPLNFSVPNVGLSQKKVDAELKSLTVTIARPDQKTGDLPAGMEQLVPQLWQTALIEATNKMAIFQDDAVKKTNLSVQIRKLNIDGAGISFSTETEARYEIMDRKSGDIIFTQDITSTGTVPFGFSVLGIARQRESVNRSVQNNITQFLQALETVDVQKPMFPAKTLTLK
ncbi:MAG: UDP-N-acetylglucosamine acyltransferase [Burkholderiaceae bacterium]